ncbi:MAG: FHA domain-containing protein [Bdellovibrionota bacterium]
MSQIVIWTIKGIAGEFEGNTLPLKAPMMTVGRTHQNHIVISDTNISRHHATFFVEGDQLFIQDEKSRNGIFVNDKKIDAGIRVLLKHNDRIMIGPHGFAVEVEEKTHTEIQHAPTREMQSTPRKEQTQFQPTTLLKHTALLEKLKGLKLPSNMPKIQLNRRTIMYGVMGLFVLMMIMTKLPKSSGTKSKPQTTPSVEILTNSSDSTNTSPLDDAEVDALKAQAKAALQFQDYLAATQLYEKIVKANPKDEYIKTQYEFSKKQLKRLIEKHLEFAKREYEKLNYERAIIEWKQVLALTLETNPEVYQQTETKIRDAEREMQKRR